MGTDPGEPAEVSGTTAALPDGARKTWSPHLELASRASALWRDLSWREASGSLGDLGTFLPLLVGLTVESGLDVGTTLIVTGVYNLVTAICFDVPMPVQPMKTIAAVALDDAHVSQIAAASASAAVFSQGHRFDRHVQPGRARGGARHGSPPYVVRPGVQNGGLRRLRRFERQGASRRGRTSRRRRRARARGLRRRAENLLHSVPMRSVPMRRGRGRETRETRETRPSFGGRANAFELEIDRIDSVGRERTSGDGCRERMSGDDDGDAFDVTVTVTVDASDGARAGSRRARALGDAAGLAVESPGRADDAETGDVHRGRLGDRDSQGGSAAAPAHHAQLRGRGVRVVQGAFPTGRRRPTRRHERRRDETRGRGDRRDALLPRRAGSPRTTTLARPAPPPRSWGSALTLGAQLAAHAAPRVPKDRARGDARRERRAGARGRRRVPGNRAGAPLVAARRKALRRDGRDDDERSRDGATTRESSRETPFLQAARPKSHRVARAGHLRVARDGGRDGGERVTGIGVAGLAAAAATRPPPAGARRRRNPKTRSNRRRRARRETL